MNHDLSITDAQFAYIHDLAERLHLSPKLIDTYASTRFGTPVKKLSRAEASALLEEMIAWKEIPAQLQRSMGQRDLPGMGDAPP